MYPILLVLGEGNLAVRLGEIMEWFEHRGIEPRNIKYRMGADHIRLRVDLARAEDARTFSEAFPGSVIDLSSRWVSAAARPTGKHRRSTRRNLDLAAD